MLLFYYLIFKLYDTVFDILFDILSFFVFYLLSKTYIYFLHVLLLLLYYFCSILLICLTAHLYFFNSILLPCLIVYLYFLYNNLFYSFIYLKNKKKNKKNYLCSYKNFLHCFIIIFFTHLYI